MTKLHIDFETRSTVELKTAGLDNYAKDPTTSPWCMAFVWDDHETVGLWHPAQPYNGLPDGSLPPAIRDHVAAGGVVYAHNATFELAIWNNICVPRYGWPELKPEQCRCTMAMAYAMALPGSLEKAAAATGIKAQKDVAGGRLMMMMAKPKTIKVEGPLTAQMYLADKAADVIEWWDEPAKLQALYEYCRQDVRVERELEQRLMPLSTQEQAIWVLDQKINNRGIYVDLEAVDAAIQVVTVEADRLNADIREATGNFVGFTTETARIKKWVGTQGVTVKGVAKNDVLDALADADVPAHVKKVLLIRQEAGKSSTAKLRAMQEATSADGRLRGMFAYHGAGTGRWAGRRVQLQNLPRPEIDQAEVESALEKIIEIDDPVATADYLNTFYGSALSVISWSLRGFLRAAPGYELMAADFANIEGRVLAWLAGEQWKLDAFAAYDAGTGPDLYLVTAGHVLGKHHTEVTKSERQSSGKVPELACGYQGGVGAFQNMAKVYNVKVSDERAGQIKEAWRDRHPKIRSYWYQVDEAVKDALRRPGGKVSVGPRGREVSYRVNGSFLWCRLPSARVICYPYARLDTCFTYKTKEGIIRKLSRRAVEAPLTTKNPNHPVGEDWTLEREDDDVMFYMTVDGTTNKWVEADTYGGKHVENIDQAFSSDLLRYAMVNAEAEGWPIVLHVHDEVVAEVKAGTRDLKEFEALCARVPGYAAGLPIAAKGWRGVRFRKD